ncbi:hypothetical protein GCM10028803_42160 [Larkinella knui]|uniref:Alpha/beta hydrolase n=1 Tax=Larkinella knui TaxID=2025310 RepID=A0A3P1CNI5_9BACT|nr:alpha/beta hydrolase [Larkinella knui]RRB14845.1 alpha/beta hydrolase [Larkinella knui]
MKEIRNNGATINYRVSGEGAITLVLVHGSFIDQTYWDQQVAFFAPHYKVVTLDLPGHGQSGRDRTDWSIEGYGDDVMAVIRELELKNVILIGHSMGADIILEVAVADPEPVIGFIAVDMFKNAATPLAEEFQSQVEAINENLRTDFPATSEQYARMALLTPQTPEPIASRVAADYRHAYPPMGRPVIAQVFEYWARERDLLPRLPFRFYVINVDFLPINEEPLKQYLTNGYEVYHLPGTCHYPMLENPDRLNQTLAEIIDKISADSQKAPKEAV